jgi:micrococcal nuclease
MKRLQVNEKWVGGFLVLLGFAGLLGACGRSPEKTKADSLPVVNVSTAAERMEKEQSQATRSEVEQDRTPTEGTMRQSCKVLKVYDGDTLACDMNNDGHIERPSEEIRLLGIDSPEMHYSRKNPTYGTDHPTDELYAPQASAWLEHEASGKTVYLEFDTDTVDRYGRTLAYVYATRLDRTTLNEKELATGDAKTLFLGLNRRYQERFELVEKKAREAKRGLWSLE